ncbi:hypothetical protein ACI513_11065 [Chryseobacterium sp. M5]|uniref:hypothetical protein n=1 Tax=Chryseobacterium sp. M5 TaxID=3379128 RepID=UPI003857DB94
MKSDLSIHNICIASIKRGTIKPYNFKWTRFYETDSKNLFTHFPFEIDEQELIICSTIIDSDNFSVLTTRKLITNENGKLQFGNLINAKDELYGDFKSKINEFTFGNVLLENGKNLKYFIETKTASMIMIRGVKTSIKIQQKTVNI